MLKEFKEFAIKGNMLDMAIGIVIGGAFGTIVKSLVADVLMPIVSGIFKMPDFSNLFIILSGKTDEVFTSVDAARDAGASVLAYGNFINALISFLIIAFMLFVIVKAVNSLKKKEEKAEEPKGPSEVELLTEIRDALKK